jgi:DNA-binding NarL/FixJ family response regulator
MQRARLLIADDHREVIRGLSMLMSVDSDVVGSATSGEEAVEKARELKPDLVLMDFSLGDMDGVEAASLIKREHPDTHVIIVSVYEAGNDAERARRAGVEKWIPKSLPPHVLLDEVRAVVRAREVD